MKRRLARAVLIVAALYALLLAVGSFALRGLVADQVEDRLARSLGARVAVGSVRLNLFVGSLTIEDVEASRSSPGSLDLHIDRIDAELAPMGGMLFDRDVSRARVRAATLDLSAIGAATIEREESRPTRIETLIIEDSSVSVVPTSYLPGVGKVELRVERSVSRGTDVSSTLAWLEGIRELDADVIVPGSYTIGATYADLMLEIRGGVLGAEPLRVPFEFPDPGQGASEIDYIEAIAIALVRALGTELARRKIVDEAWEWLTE